MIIRRRWVRVTRSLMVAALCAGLLLPLLSVPVAATSANYVVTRTADDQPLNNAACNVAASGGCTLRQAVNASNAHSPGSASNTITFAPGVTGTITLTAVLQPSTNVAITGPGASALTISGNTMVPLFHVTGIIFAIQSLTLFAGTNTVRDGGAINADHTAGVTVKNVTFVGNTAGNGGAIAAFFSPAFTVENCLFVLNSASSLGGAITLFGTIITVRNSTFVQNSADIGGGMYLYAGKSDVFNSTFTRNTATGYGGGIASDAIGLALHQSLLSGNMGGDIDGTGTATDGTVIGGAPLLDVLQYNAPGTTATLALLPGSPATDVGPCPTGITADQCGIARPQGASCDAGAFESRGFSFANPQGALQRAAVGEVYAAPLSVSVISAVGESVAGGQVTFTAPTTGPQVTFDTNGTCAVTAGGSVATCTLVADTGGAVATSPPLRANGIAGVVTVTATARGVATPITFALGNVPTVSSIGPASGDVRGGGVVTIRGTGFGTDPNTVQVTFAAPGENATSDGVIVEVTDTTIRLTPPPRQRGAVMVWVSVNGVGSVTSLPFTYGVVLAQPTSAPTAMPQGVPRLQPTTHPTGGMAGVGTPTPLPQPARH